MNLPDIDFSKIRVYQKSQNKSFEELTVQLFRSTFPTGTEFYRVDDKGGDGGVEDIAIISDTEIIGLQSKYFDTLGASQWSQINKSVRTAVKKHSPQLIEYRIATPVNRSKNSKSWDNYTKKWISYAKTECGYMHDISFIWIGDTELRDELVKDQHRSKVLYWFGFPSYCPEWIKQQYDKSRDQIDTRYTPTLHVKTKTELLLNAFCLTENFHASLIKHLTNVKNHIDSIDDRYTELDVILKGVLIVSKRNLISLFTDNFKLPSFSNLIEKVDSLIDVIHQIKRFYYKSTDEHEENDTDIYTPNPYDYSLRTFSNIENSVYSFREFLRIYKLYDKQLVLIDGEAGIGKSHLLTNLAKQCIDRNQAALLFLGEQFSSNDIPQVQMNKICSWNSSFSSLLHVLDCEAEITGRPSLIIIDAINESYNKQLWRSHLIGLIHEIKAFSHIKLVLSCRTDFSSFVLPESILDTRMTDCELLHHEGYDLEFSKAVEMYFNGYNLKTSHFPPLLEEFRNPLFLKLFCEAYENSTVPFGAVSLVTVMEARIKKCKDEMQKIIDCPAYKVDDAINFIAQTIANNYGNAISRDMAQRELDFIFSGSGASHSLYFNLRSHGMLTETMDYRGNELVRFQYERFSDYFVASQMLLKYPSFKELQIALTNNEIFLNWMTDYKVLMQSRGILKMMAILIPEKFQYELVDLLKDSQYMKYLYQDFFDSLSWRTKSSITDRTYKLFNNCEEILGTNTFLDGLFILAAIPDHPFNARWLHARLKSLTLVKREQLWTIPITTIMSDYGQKHINSFITWVFNMSDDMISNEQAWLVALALSWLLSSNYRLLRLRASLALIKVLKGRVTLVIQLIDEFHECNDPYITERIYATACGVTLRENKIEVIRNICDIVFNKMFLLNNVPTNILQRDFAQRIIAYGDYRNALSDRVDISKCTPPFRSNNMIIPEDVDIRKLETIDGWGNICESLQPERLMPYGDFGRYIMDSAVHHFANQKLDQAYIAKSKYDDIFDGWNAKKIILKRIKDLGWDDSLFYEYEQPLNRGRLRVDQEEHKIERISKKYQWIGLYELIGTLADHNWMHPFDIDDESEIFQNPGQVYLRNFDPTQPLVDPINTNTDTFDEEECEIIQQEHSYNFLINDFSDLKLLIDREKWVTTPPLEFDNLIEYHSSFFKNEDYLILAGLFERTEDIPLDYSERDIGKNKMWTDLRCLLIKNDDTKDFLRHMVNVEFHGNGIWNVELGKLWIGEYPWAPDVQRIKENCSFPPEMISEVSVDVIQTHCEYRNEFYHNALVPSPQVIEMLGLFWNGNNFSYVDANGEIIATCLSDEHGQIFLIIKKEHFLKKVKDYGYIPLWATLSEKSCYSYLKEKSIVKKWGITQRIYGFEDKRLMKFHEKYYEKTLYN